MRPRASFQVLLLAVASAGCGRSGASHVSSGPSAEGSPPRAQASVASKSAEPVGAPLHAARFIGRACAQDAAGAAWCWRHPLGDSRPGLVPRRVPELDQVRDMASTAYFTYLLRPDGQVSVWGKQKHPYLGDVTTPRPFETSAPIRQIGEAGAFVVMLDGARDAWAVVDDLVSPEPGEPGEIISKRPELLRHDVEALSSPAGLSLIDAAGRVLVLRGPDWVPIDVPKTRAVADGAGLSCTLLERSIECWDGRGQGRFSLVAPADVAAIRLSVANIYALGRDGRVWASLEATIPRQLVPVSGLSNVAELGPGSGSAESPYCFRMRDQSLGCWGRGESRRVGSGEWPASPRLAPLHENADAASPAATPH